MNEWIQPYDHPDYFTLKILHGGCILGNKYVGVKTNYFDNVDKDKMSFVEIDSMLQEINPAYAHQRMDYWYSVGVERGCLMKLESDWDVLVMCTSVPLVRLIFLYLDHKEPEDDDFFIYEDLFVMQPSNVLIEEIEEARPSKGVVIKEPSEGVPTQCSIAGGKNNKEKGKQKQLEVPKVMKPRKKVVQLAWEGSNDVGQSSSGFGSSVVEQGNLLQNVAGNLQDFDNFDFLDFQQSYGGQRQGRLGYEDEPSNSEDSDYVPLPDDEDYDKYGDDEDDYIVEEIVDEEEQRKRSLLNGYDGSINGENMLQGGKEFIDNEDMFGGVDSDEEPPNYIVNSDGEREEQGLYFNPKIDMVRPRFQLNMMFGSVMILRDALRLMALQGGWEYQYEKNDKVRLKAICKQDNCPFLLFASKTQHEDTLKIKEWIPHHTCTRTFNNTMVRMKLLVRKFKDRIALNPDWNPESLAKTMSSELRAKVNKQMAYKVKVAVLEEVEGSIRDQFARLKDYENELKRVDPDTTVDIRCDFSNSNKDPVFQRMYICLGALKNGIKSGCRTVIGLDGAFLKSPFGGQLLTAVGVDANNNSWVIAYAMVENENKDSWIWFLELLCKDLDIKEDGVGWVFISDKQKGLIPACQVVVPSGEIRFCVRHMWTNFTKLFPGKVLKDQMWKCAKDTTMPYYLKDMEEMNDLNEDAYKWMTHEDRPPRHWCRAFFNTTSNCDIMDNNICESFNAVIVDARKKPPITMFEEIRWKLMKRIQMRRQIMDKYEYNICPKPRDTLDKNKIRAVDCTSTFNGGDRFEVENIQGTKNVVDLRLRTCSCRRWDLTGIPCKHAVSAIYWKREAPEDYVAECYSKKTYMAIYSNFIYPINSIDMWSRCEGPAILPPSYSRMPGRPKSTKRKKDQSEKFKDASENTEGKLGRQQRSLKCGICGIVGHNKITCHRHLPPKENKKRKASNEGHQVYDQPKKPKRPPMTLNEMRAKTRKNAKNQREKYAAAKAAKLAATKSSSSTVRPSQVGGRPVQSATAPTSRLTQNTVALTSRPAQSSAALNSMSRQSASASSTRASQRIRNRSVKGD